MLEPFLVFGVIFAVVGFGEHLAVAAAIIFVIYARMYDLSSKVDALIDLLGDEELIKKKQNK